MVVGSLIAGAIGLAGLGAQIYSTVDQNFKYKEMNKRAEREAEENRRLSNEQLAKEFEDRKLQREWQQQEADKAYEAQKTLMEMQKKIMEEADQWRYAQPTQKSQTVYDSRQPINPYQSYYGDDDYYSTR